MPFRVKKLKNYISKHPSHFKNNEFDTVLDTLYYNCAEHNQTDNDIIRNSFNSLYQCMEHLNLRKKDSIIDIVCTLCNEHARIFFAVGVKVGIHLLQELS